MKTSQRRRRLNTALVKRTDKGEPESPSYASRYHLIEELLRLTLRDGGGSYASSWRGRVT
jgi:hypothetical protein